MTGQELLVLGLVAAVNLGLVVGVLLTGGLW